MTNDKKLQLIVEYLTANPDSISKIFSDLNLKADYYLEKYYEEGFSDGFTPGRRYNNIYKSRTDECLNYEDGFDEGLRQYREKTKENND